MEKMLQEARSRCPPQETGPDGLPAEVDAPSVPELTGECATEALAFRTSKEPRL